MANYKLIFGGTIDSETSDNELYVGVNDHQEVFLCIKDENYKVGICLDKETAVKFLDELKHKILLLDEIVEKVILK